MDEPWKNSSLIREEADKAYKFMILERFKHNPFDWFWFNLCASLHTFKATLRSHWFRFKVNWLLRKIHEIDTQEYRAAFMKHPPMIYDNAGRLGVYTAQHDSLERIKFEMKTHKIAESVVTALEERGM